MTKNDILDWFTVNNETLYANKILLVLGIGIITALIIFVTYRITYSGVCYNARFNVGNAVMLLIAAVVMLMISSNIVISMGMVGALSIVRFRTAVKDAQDTVYIFWSIVEGSCIGAQIYKLAIISTVVIAIIMVAASFYYNSKKKFLIIVRGNSKINTDDILNCLKRGKNKKALLKAANYGIEYSELIFEVSAKHEIDAKLIDELRSIDNVQSVNWLLEMGEHIG